MQSEVPEAQPAFLEQIPSWPGLRNPDSQFLGKITFDITNTLGEWEA